MSGKRWWRVEVTPYRMRVRRPVLYYGAMLESAPAAALSEREGDADQVNIDPDAEEEDEEEEEDEGEEEECRAEMQLLVRIVSDAEGGATPHDGRWLVAWDPHTRFGTLALTSSPDRSVARRFGDIVEITREWRTISAVQPVRPDGEPNRPLTAITTEIVPADGEA